MPKQAQSVPYVIALRHYNLMLLSVKKASFMSMMLGTMRNAEHGTVKTGML